VGIIGFMGTTGPTGPTGINLPFMAIGGTYATSTGPNGTPVMYCIPPWSNPGNTGQIFVNVNATGVTGGSDGSNQYLFLARSLGGTASSGGV
jgi:hypothetical protein